MQHVCIRSVGKRSVTFLGSDAPAHFLDLVAEPDLLEIVVMIAEITEIVGPHTTRPDGAIGIDLRTHPAGVTVDDLVLLFENALDQLVVLYANCLSNFGDTRELFTLDIGNQPVDGF